MPTNPDPTQGNSLFQKTELTSRTQAASQGTAKGGLLSKLKALQETINDLQQQLTEITEELEGTE